MVFGFFDWVAPLLLGLHICIRWSMYEEHKKAIEQSFLWATLLLGLYGIYQFIAAPPWDCAWLEGLPQGFENFSFGHPNPFEIRVWSTLNSPGSFAVVMLAALILLFGTKTRYKAIFAAAGYISLILTMVRTSWLAWLLAVVLLVSNYRGAMLRRFLFGLILLPLCLLPIAFNPEIAQMAQDRLATMQNVQQDGSFQDRRAMYEVVTEELLKNPAGIGLRNQFTVDGFVLDSGFLQALAMLGFTGTALYAVGDLVWYPIYDNQAGRHSAKLGSTGKRVPGSGPGLYRRGFCRQPVYERGWSVALDLLRAMDECSSAKIEAESTLRTRSNDSSLPLTGERF